MCSTAAPAGQGCASASHKCLGSPCNSKMACWGSVTVYLDLLLFLQTAVHWWQASSWPMGPVHSHQGEWIGYFSWPSGWEGTDLSLSCLPSSSSKSTATSSSSDLGTWKALRVSRRLDSLAGAEGQGQRVRHLVLPPRLVCPLCANASSLHG